MHHHIHPNYLLNKMYGDICSLSVISTLLSFVIPNAREYGLNTADVAHTTL